MALITGGIPVHSETNSVSLGSKRHEAITVGPRGREGLSALQCLVNVLFDRWRSSFYVMAIIIMEWVHITGNGCETVNRRALASCT